LPVISRILRTCGTWSSWKPATSTWCRFSSVRVQTIRFIAPAKPRAPLMVWFQPSTLKVATR
jgi:hypothetical protein